MISRLLLECQGLLIDGISVPAFQVVPGELVAVVHPNEEGVADTLLKLLSGLSPTKEVKLHCQISILNLFPSGDILGRKLTDALCERGLSSNEAQQVIVTAGCRSDVTYGDLQLTNRYLLEIGVSLLRGDQLMVFSTAGLDPLGMLRVMTVAGNSRTQCSSLALLHESLASYLESTDLQDRLYTRKLYISKRQSLSATGNSA